MYFFKLNKHLKNAPTEMNSYKIYNPVLVTTSVLGLWPKTKVKRIFIGEYDIHSTGKYLTLNTKGVKLFKHLNKDFFTVVECVK